MTWGELAGAAGGRLVRGQAADRLAAVSTDTRRLAPGQAFWALRGARYDAHDFLDAGLASRSSGWVVAQGSRRPAVLPAHLVEVADPLRGLQALASRHRRRWDIPVVCITGSNGKTTTKEMLRAICARIGPTCANEGNLNNEIGLPLSVLELQSHHRYAVFELGASRPGDIRDLGGIAQPTLAVLLNIGPAHLETFGSLEGTFRAKTELIACLPRDGRVVLNADDPWLAPLAGTLGPRAVTFGAAAGCRVRLEGEGSLVIDQHRVAVRLEGFGKMLLCDAAAAAAAAWALGIAPDAVAQGLEDFRPAPLRMQRERHPSGCEVVLDAYNANPDSMKASLEAFCERFPGRRKVAVLGDMKELGPDSARLHREFARWLVGLPLDAVYLAGPEMAHAAEILRGIIDEKTRSPRWRHALEPGDWLEELRGELKSGAALLFKASRAMRFEEVWRDVAAAGPG